MVPHSSAIATMSGSSDAAAAAVGSASIVDLKAELARKQQEFRRQKQGSHAEQQAVNRARARASSKRGPAEWATRLGRKKSGGSGGSGKAESSNKGVADRDARDREAVSQCPRRICT